MNHALGGGTLGRQLGNTIEGFVVGGGGGDAGCRYSYCDSLLLL